MTGICSKPTPGLFLKLPMNKPAVIIITATTFVRRFAPALAEEFSSELTEADSVLAREIAKNPGVTSEALRALLDAYSTMAYAAVPHLPLELAVIEITGGGLETRH